MKSERKIILSIETAIEGGSISIIEENNEIDFWIGAKESSKAEDFLAEISKILVKNKIEKKDIKLIAVSNGPGSFTGIKIGLATARGLRTALDCEVMEISLLEAIWKFVDIDGNKKAIILFQIGKDLFSLEKVEPGSFNDSKKNGQNKALTIEKLNEELKLLSNTRIIVPRKILNGYNNLVFEFIDKSNQLILFEEKLAFIISRNLTFGAASDNESI